MNNALFHRAATRWPLLIAAAVSAYSLLLLYNVSSSQSQLRAEKDLRIVADSQRRAVAVADLIAERRNSTMELAESSEISNYFINKSLGMSPLYGLNASLGSIEARFRLQADKKNLRGEHIFNRIIFYDETGQILVDLSTSKAPPPLAAMQATRPTVFIDPQSEQIVISAPVIYKGMKNGVVASIGDIRQISRDLINTDDNYRELLVTNTGRELPGPGKIVQFGTPELAALSQLPEQILSPLDQQAFSNATIGGHLAVRTKIPDSELSLVTVLAREAAYGQVSSRFFLYSAGAFPLILLIAALLFERVRRVGIALARSEQRFHTIFDNVRDVIFVLDVSSVTIVEANPRVLSLYGYAPDEIAGMTIADVSAGNEADTMQKWIEYVAEATSGKPQLFSWLARRKNGESFWVEISLLHAVINQHDRLLVVAHDITQRKAQEQALILALEHQQNLNKKLEEAQSQLLQSEKMASIGQLAAGIAHEINNPIGFVNSNIGTLSGYVTSLLKMLAAHQQDEVNLSTERREALMKLRASLDIDYLSEDVSHLLQESIDGLQRIRKIVTDLKDFSHVDETEFQRANLERGLDSTLNVVRNELKYKAEVIKEYGNIPEIDCLPSQLNQVFMNLLINAAQAIPEHGIITIRTGFDEMNLWIDIEDTGSGISQEHLSRIFEPFFTTKPVGKGTGLGLSLAYGIVKKHGGHIEVSSKIGSGSQFRVVLPLLHPATATAN